MTPFEIVYGFNPATPITFKPLPPAEIVSLEGETKAEYIKKIHQKVKENLERRTEAYVRNANKGRKRVAFKEGDWVWLHMRPERFPQKRKNKLAPRGDGPFRVLKKINDNAYHLDLPGEFNISPAFNVADLELFDAGDDLVLETKPLEEGGNDEDIGHADHSDRRPNSPDSNPSTADDPDVPDGPEDPTMEVPTAPEGPMTRARAKALGHKFTQFVDRIMEVVPTAHGPRPESAPEMIGPNGFLSSDQDPWVLLSHQTAGSGVFTITLG